MWENNILITFIILSKNARKWLFDHIYYLEQKCPKNDYLITFTIPAKMRKMIIWSHLLSWAKMPKKWLFGHIYYPGKNAQNDYLITFTILSKNAQKRLFDHIYYPQQNCAKMIFWLHLLPWAKMCKNDYLIAFAILSETVWKWLFDRICYPRQTSAKPILWTHLPLWQSSFKMSVLISRLLPLQMPRKQLSYLCFCVWEQIWNKCGIYHHCRDCKSVASLILRSAANLSKQEQMWHLR